MDVGRARSPNVNPSDASDIVGEPCVAPRAGRCRDHCCSKRHSRHGRAQLTAITCEHLKKASDEILARKDELGLLLSREPELLPEGIGEAARARQIFCVLRWRMPAHGGEKLASVRPASRSRLPVKD